ncbi:hypothetical protein KBC86_05310, partial [Candidatus Gracilibacteria bacterium]|nr:hypothetical protein [Candidatus Gracilibacteria bacterium]
ASMKYNSFGQKQYFNPLNSGLGLIGDAVKGTFRGIGRTVVDVNNAVARTLGFKSGNALSVTGLALAGGIYFGAEALSGSIESATGATQAAVTSTLQNTGVVLGIAAGTDLAVNTIAQKAAGKNYRG